MRDRLRNATAQAHQELDEGLRGAFATRDGYAAFLQATHRLVERLEHRLEAFGVLDPGGPSRARAIESDLAALDVDVPAPASTDFEPSSRAEAFGCAYVVEGSALGGLYLARQLERSGDDRAGFPVGYLTFRGADTAAGWRAFLAKLEAWSVEAGEDALAAAERAAARTFATYLRAYTDVGVFAEEPCPKR